MTRSEALKIAQECIADCMRPLAFDANIALNTKDPPETTKRRAARYAALAAALAWIENAAKQKELHL